MRRSKTGGGVGTNGYQVRGVSTQRIQHGDPHRYLGALASQAAVLAAPDEEDEPTSATIETVREAVGAATSLVRAVWPEAYGDAHGGDTVVGATRTEAEAAVREAGRQIDSLARERAASRLAEIEADYSPTLDDDLAANTAGLARVQEAFDDLFKELEAGSRSARYPELDQEQRSLYRAGVEMTAFRNERDWRLNDAVAQETLGVLREIREMGPGGLPEGLRLHHTTPRPVARVLSESASFFPTAWLRR